MPSRTGLRVLGVSIPDVSDWCEPEPQGKWSQFFGALAQRVELVDVVHPEVSRKDFYLSLARGFHPHINRWRARAGFNPKLVARRTEAVQRGLLRHAGSYDLVMQLQTLCAPSVNGRDIPYAIYTDSTMALTRRLYPPRALLSASEAEWSMRFEADVCRSATAVFTFSEFARGSVIEDYGCSPDRVFAVGAGANQLVSSLGEKDYSVPRVMFVGIDFTCKGGYVLLDAWPIVRKRVPNAELIIAGPKRNPARRLPDGVRWVGWVDRAGLAELYQSASVFAMPSLFDAWGHAFLEAMGYGLPCIGTSCCAMPEIIDDGGTGRLVARYEPEPLADALTELLTDPVKTAAMGHAAHANVLKEHLWADVADRVMTGLDATLSVGAGSGQR
jgi:glycosyltransferase involved in cell wall biosynthesis